jgi:hypothetical protein
VGLLILAAGIAVGWNVLAGRTWARWTAIVLAGLLTLLSATAVFALAYFAIWSLNSAEMQAALEPQAKSSPETMTFQPQRFILAMVSFYALPGVFGLLLGITALWSLLTRAAGEWFRFASSIREEHRQLKREIG